MRNNCPTDGNHRACPASRSGIGSQAGLQGNSSAGCRPAQQQVATNHCGGACFYAKTGWLEQKIRGASRFLLFDEAAQRLLCLTMSRCLIAQRAQFRDDNRDRTQGQDTRSFIATNVLMQELTPEVCGLPLPSEPFQKFRRYYSFSYLNCLKRIYILTFQ